MFTVVTVGFPSTALSGTEGERLSVCVEVESGSVQLPTLVNVDFSITDITTSGTLNSFVFAKKYLRNMYMFSDCYCVHIYIFFAF